MEGAEEVAFAAAGHHLCFQHLLVELEVDLLSQRPDVADVDAVLMQDVLDALAVHQEDRRVVQHLRQRHYVVFLHPLARVGQLELPLGVRLLADLAEDHVGEGRFGADDHLGTQVAH